MSSPRMLPIQTGVGEVGTLRTSLQHLLSGERAGKRGSIDRPANRRALTGLENRARGSVGRGFKSLPPA
jgi:hypothetical protein